MSTIIKSRRVPFGEHPFLDSLRRAGKVWQGYIADDQVVIVATSNGLEWAAYYETPQSIRMAGHGYVQGVADFGNKLPEDAARELFPDVPAGLEWRA